MANFRIFSTMKTTEILVRLQQAKFSEEQARTIAEILEEAKEQQVTKEHVEMVVSKAKYDLVKWIVGGVVANGIVATLLKYFS